MDTDSFVRQLDTLLQDLPAGRRDAILSATRRLRRYASLMEQSVAVSHAALAGARASEVARLILDGAQRIGHYPDGAFILATDDGPRIVATHGRFSGWEGQRMPPEFLTAQTSRLGPGQVRALNEALGLELSLHDLYLVPFQPADRCAGALALIDVDGETPDDRMLESYVSRAAHAYLSAARRS